jgi:transcriptional regulator with XRE-family HTH domain
MASYTSTSRKLYLIETLAKNVRYYRQQLGISQEALADICHLHRTYIGSVERCERNVTLATVETLAKGLRINVCDLLTPRGK